MARTWLSVTVEPLGGRGDHFWPCPGRIFAVGPTHTFRDLADAINGSFSRWDRCPVSVFTLADGRVVAPQVSSPQKGESAKEAAAEKLDIESTTVASVVEPGAEFQFIFDRGDDWVHHCRAADRKIDPEDATADLGIVADRPLPYQSWGSVPDQYGRRWADDWGMSPQPRRPSQPHPMLLHMWPETEKVAELDMSAVHHSLTNEDVEGFITAVTGCNIDDVLQQVGGGLPPLLLRERRKLEAMTRLFVDRLTARDWAGDAELAEDLAARLHGEPLAGRVAPVDLDMLSEDLEGDPNLSRGGHVDLQTGMTWGAELLEDMDEDDEMDVDDPDRWLFFACTGSREGWRDMADFAERQTDAALRQRLETAIEGRGAFRRFRDVIHQADIGLEWNAFSRERMMGRARAFLAEEGIRVGNPEEEPGGGGAR